MYLKSLRIKEKNVTFAPKVCEIFKHIHIVGVLKKMLFQLTIFGLNFLPHALFQALKCVHPLHMYVKKSANS